ncbi:arylsulfotransferase family protein [Tropicimonas sediminicola]|uniref:Arylsulfotransferase (ASST) n=1 Tax=Tropicimonas sediminicola TaxID=1031541 RepID=A0A239MCX1_9RHOB|nr:arylsulfotransferase family protein [Tropicimonas sediminicola]SNT40867.1 Arylsulfotransferase (ASST) [Tropicimonas sediminicola]
MSSRLYLVLFTMAVGILVGAATVHFRLFPYQMLMSAKATVEDVMVNWEAFLGRAPVNQLIPGGYDGDGVTILDAQRSAPGNTLMAGVKGNAVALWLVTPEGETLREWQPPTTEILTDAEHIDGVEKPFNDFFVTLHGAALLPDGGTLFTISHYALVKMSACGTNDWVVPTMAHHAVFASHDQTYWAVTRFHHDTDHPDHNRIRPQFWEDAVIQVDSNGTILRTISILDVIEKNRLWGKLFGGQRPVPSISGDITHLNDVEVLSPEMADAYPDFDAGDVMVSLRNPNMVIVFDPETLDAKWSKVGPWIRQHDPDFGADGWIAVLDNRNDGADGTRFGGSRVVLIRPKGPFGGEWRVAYENSASTPFFTAKRGVLDLPGNGNILVTESEAGRVFEFDRSGDIVWEYINRYDAENLTSVMHAERYPPDFAVNAYSNCDQF